ncbi:MAG: phosphoglycerate mutase, partial [Proteobacteria bacterium]
MRDLHLIRHAKSSWDEPHLADYERPLNARGLRAAPLIGRAMAARVPTPPTFFVSTARRARETYRGLLKGWPTLEQSPVSEERTLYTFSWDGLRDWLS